MGSFGINANSTKDWFMRTRGQLGNTWGSTTNAAASGWNAVNAAGTSVYNSTSTAANAAGGFISSTGVAATNTYNTYAPAAANIVAQTGQAAQTTYNAAPGFLSQAWTSISDTTAAAANTVANIPDNVGGAVYDAHAVVAPKVRAGAEFVNRRTQKDQATIGRLYGDAKDIGNMLTDAGTDMWNRLTGKPVKSSSGRHRLYRPIKKDTSPAPENTNRNIGDELAKTTQPPAVVDFEKLYANPAKSISYPKNEAKGLMEDIPATNTYFSLFNDWSLMHYKGGLGIKDAIVNPSADEPDAFNRPTVFPDQLKEAYRNPTVQTIIEECKKYESVSYVYRYFDFALAKYHGRIPNNYLVTLRRFPMPVEDNIISSKVVNNAKVIENGLPAIAQAVTWFGEETGNELKDMLKFTVNQKWENVEAALQTIDGGGSGGQVQSQIGGHDFMSAVWGAANNMDAAGVRAAREGHDPLTDTYPNHVFGPINVIKEVAVRQQGLTFANDITLVFKYDLRQIKGVNPKIAFLDLMTNLLALTYNNGNFWGGAVRYTGGGRINKPIGDQSKLKSGDYGGFFKSIVESALTGMRNIFDNISENGLLGSSVAKNFIGGKLMNMFGTPQGGQAVKAFLTGEATGDMHVVIGNPLNPIAVIGNMYCDSAEFVFDGEMSFDGFPTELTLTVNLKHARPRDKADIESMFNGGKGRMYLQPEGGANLDRPYIATAYGGKDKGVDLSLIEKMTNG